MAVGRLGVTLASAFILGSFGLVGACGIEPEIEPSEEVGQSSGAIRGGYADDKDPAAVAIVEIQQGGLCSGSLIGPNLVLTARHCVSNTLKEVGGGVDCGYTTHGSPFKPDRFAVTTNEDAFFSQSLSDYYTVSEVVVLPEDEDFCGTDQAILILDRNIPADVATPYVPRVDSQLAKGEEYYAIGYGATSDSGGGAGQRRRRDELFVDCAEGDCKGVSSFVKKTEWIGDTGICSGDSGGPALDLKNRVVGVTSRGGQNCDSPIYGAVHGWSDWIKETAIHAADVGGYDPPAWTTGFPTDPEFNFPIGGECGDTCASGICVSNQCTRQCSDEAACPSGYECATVTDDGLKACKVKPKAKPTEDNDDDGESELVADCSMSVGGADPTNPTPWRSAVLALTVLAAVLRLRRRG